MRRLGFALYLVASKFEMRNWEFIPQHTMEDTTAPKTWEIEAQKSRNIREDSNRKEWLIPQASLPSLDRLNVLSVPEESGLLSQTELEITRSDATKLVQKMGAGVWSAEAVTVAFLKRATIGQQLVSLVPRWTDGFADNCIAEQRNRVYG